MHRLQLCFNNLFSVLLDGCLLYIITRMIKDPHEKYFLVIGAASVKIFIQSNKIVALLGLIDCLPVANAWLL